MAKEVKYGMISDIHEDPRIIVPALQALKSQGAEKLIINGDIGGRGATIQDSQQYTAFILNKIAESGLEAFVQPGSHETLLGYDPVIKHFSKKHSNIIDVTDPKNQKIESDGHNLVFLPGSDFLCGGEYQIGSQLPTGLYVQNGNELVQLADLDQYVGLLDRGIRLPIIRSSNMNDLTSLVAHPEKTIVVCHVPAKFNNGNTGVDMAHFHQQRVYHKDPKNISNWTYTELAVVPGFVSSQELAKRNNTLAFGLNDSDEKVLSETLQYMIKEGVDRWAVFVERKANRGNAELGKLYDKLGIRKAVTGHFHESSHNAHDRKGNPISENNYVNELFWNSGHLDKGYTGILTVKGEEVKYQNIDLSK